MRCICCRYNEANFTYNGTTLCTRCFIQLHPKIEEKYKSIRENDYATKKEK